MISRTSGKFGYSLYTGNEAIRQEEKFSKNGTQKLLITVEDLVLPTLKNQLSSRQSSFAVLVVLPIKHVASGRDSNKKCWKLDLVGIGDSTQNLQNLMSILTENQCCILLLGPLLVPKQTGIKYIFWIPPGLLFFDWSKIPSYDLFLGASEEEKQRYNESRTEFHQRVNEKSLVIEHQHTLKSLCEE